MAYRGAIIFFLNHNYPGKSSTYHMVLVYVAKIKPKGSTAIKNMVFGVKQTRTQTLAPLLASWVTLGRLLYLKLSEIYFLHL